MQRRQHSAWASVAAAVVAVALGSLGGVLAAGPTVRLDKKVYKSDESIEVAYTAPGDYPEGAWIGIIPASVPHGSESAADEHDVHYQYVGASASGTLTMPAPLKPGEWTVRFLDGRGKEVASAAFSIERPDYGKAKVTVTPNPATPGAPLEVRYTAPEGLPERAWIGLIPSSVPHGDESVNDRHDVAYSYFTETSGVLNFDAPEKGGSWDLRMNTGAGEEIASVTFMVKMPDVAGASLTLEKTAFIPGEEIRVTFRAPKGLSPRAWIGLVPAKIPHGDETVNDEHDLSWQYMDGKTAGTMDFRAPTEAGAFTFRMHDTDSDGREIASVEFAVKSEVAASDLREQIARQGRVAVYGIRFATGKATINAESAAALAQIAALLKDDAALALRIEGHTDNVGDDTSNMDLSKRRAASVKDHLVKEHGIDAARLTTEGFGESRPVAPNDTEAGRAQNRRVELARP